MAAPNMRPYDPYQDWNVEAGRENFNQLIVAETDTMAGIDHHKSYLNFRKQALHFMQTNYTPPLQFDALIPYMAITLVDRFFFDYGKIQLPIVSPRPEINTDLFLTCFLTISWKLQTETFDLENFLDQKEFTEEDVIEMEKIICKELDWCLRTVMPFRFVEFYVPILDDPPPLRLVYQLIVKAQYDAEITKFRPSVIAASAMQIVIKNVLSDQVEAYQTNILNSVFLQQFEAEIIECSVILDKLFKAPSTASPAPADIGGTSSSAVPIPDDEEAPTHREGKAPMVEEDAAGEINHPIEDEDIISDDLMNFKLEWIELEEAERERKAEEAKLIKFM